MRILFSARVRTARGGRIYFISVLAVVAATLVAQLMVPFFDLSNIGMIYILGVVVVKYQIRSEAFYPRFDSQCRRF
ncbi:MAG: hypothetical protein R3C24_18555 [Cyanobacteriota/Melainabacteria group bacterium]